MERIIDGKIYDTKKSIKIAETDIKYAGVFDKYKKILAKSKNGSFFILKKFMSCIDCRCVKIIEPVLYTEALTFFLENGDRNKLKKYFNVELEDLYA